MLAMQHAILQSQHAMRLRGKPFHAIAHSADNSAACSSTV